MEIELKNQTEKPFFERQEYSFEVMDDATPSYDLLKSEIGKKLNVDAGLVIIKKVENQFGKKSVKVIAYIYKTKEAMMKYEDIKEEKAVEKPVEAAAPAPAEKTE